MFDNMLCLTDQKGQLARDSWAEAILDKAQFWDKKCYNVIIFEDTSYWRFRERATVLQLHVQKWVLWKSGGNVWILGNVKNLRRNVS